MPHLANQPKHRLLIFLDSFWSFGGDLSTGFGWSWLLLYMLSVDWCFYCLSLMLVLHTLGQIFALVFRHVPLSMNLTACF